MSLKILNAKIAKLSEMIAEKENELKKSLDVVAQEEEPDEVSKEFANKLGVDAKNVVSMGKRNLKCTLRNIQMQLLKNKNCWRNLLLLM